MESSKGSSEQSSTNNSTQNLEQQNSKINSSIKLNLGCGFQKKEGYINVDIDEGSMPDLQLDLATQAWPWETASVSEVIFEYSLEQMGQTIHDLRHVLQELYRVCAPDAKIFITAFHPRSDQFYLNPACTQRISPEFFHLLSLEANLAMIASRASHDVFGIKWGVNFNVRNFKYLISPLFQQDVESGKISEPEIRRRMMHENNICQAFEVEMVAVKRG